MTGEIVAVEITKYERVLEAAKRLGLVDYVPHFENILTELKALQELVREVGDELAKEHEQ